MDELRDTNKLPLGKTCFFRIELAPYESAKLLKQKLLYAIHHCTAIDADYDRVSVPIEEDDHISNPNLNPAHEDESVISEGGRNRNGGVFGDDHDDYGDSQNEEGMEEEEEE